MTETELKVIAALTPMTPATVSLLRADVVKGIREDKVSSCLVVGVRFSGAERCVGAVDLSAPGVRAARQTERSTCGVGPSPRSGEAVVRPVERPAARFPRGQAVLRAST